MEQLIWNVTYNNDTILIAIKQIQEQLNLTKLPTDNQAIAPEEQYRLREALEMILIHAEMTAKDIDWYMTHTPEKKSFLKRLFRK